jgi:hypothetical protein
MIFRFKTGWLIPHLVGLIFTLLPLESAAHEIPSDVTVQAWIRPEAQQLHVLIRVPMDAMADMTWPTRGPGYLDLARIENVLRDAATLWIANDIEIYEDDRRLPIPGIAAVRVSLPSDASFASYEQARAHITRGQLAENIDLYWQQGMLDVALEYPIRSDQSEFSVRPGLERLGLRVLTVIRFVLPDGTVRAFEVLGDPGIVRLDPRWYQAAARFVEFGFFHILDGIDHLLFLLCLVIPLRRWRSLVMVVTSFTFAHSITLIASAYGLAPTSLWFPPLVETLIAMSIVYMAIENVVSTNVERRWMITLGFGLVHGFGFSFALRETLQFAGSHLLGSLVAFNIGVELGQLFVLALVMPALGLLFRYGVAERIGTIVLSVLVAHTAWHWMVDRAEVLRQYPWPSLSASLLTMAVGWLIFALVLAGLAWLVSGFFSRRAAANSGEAAVMETPGMGD